MKSKRWFVCVPRAHRYRDDVAPEVFMEFLPGQSGDNRGRLEGFSSLIAARDLLRENQPDLGATYALVFVDDFVRVSVPSQKLQVDGNQRFSADQ